MAIITLKNGTVVNFSREPTKEDIAFVEKQYGIAPVPQEKNMLKKTGDTLGAIFGGNKIGEALGNQIAKGNLGKGIQELWTGQKITPEMQNYLNQNKGPTLKEILGDTASIATNFIPVGKLAKGGKYLLGANKSGSINSLKRAGVNIGVGAGTGYTAETSRDIAQGQDDAFKIGAGTIFGGSIPIAGSLLSRIPGTTKTISSFMNGVPRETLQRAADPRYSKRIEKTINEIADNERQPFFTLVNKIAGGINKAEEKATKTLRTAVDAFIKENPVKAKKFDVRPQMTEIRKSLWPFRDSGLIVSQKKLPTGEKMYSVKNSAQGAFTNREIGALNGLLNKINSAKKIGVRDVLALRKSFSTAYDAIPLGNNGQPTPYHAAVMAMKKKAEDIIDNILPESVKTANAGYRSISEMRDVFGNRIVDSTGAVKDNAEQYISNLGNINKEQLRKEIGKFSNQVGLDLVDEVQIIKDAQRLADFFPRTGSRTADIIRSLAISGLGFGTGGAPGAIVGIGASSPKVAGKIATTIGKVTPSLQRAKEIAQQFTGINGETLLPGDALVNQYIKILDKGNLWNKLWGN